MTIPHKNKKIILFFACIIGIASTGIVNQTSACSHLPANQTARMFTLMLAIGLPSFIRLYTKGTPKELKYKKELPDNYSNLNDYVQLLKVWNILFHPCQYISLVDKHWVGTPLKLEDQEIKEISEDGLKEVTTKKKNLECLPTGICGTIDTYVFKQIEKLYKIIGNIETALIVYCILQGVNIKKIQELWLPKNTISLNNLPAKV
ncbi:MAG: hypothetical protein WCD44_03205 [Candidatus Babeliales bacterium]